MTLLKSTLAAIPNYYLSLLTIPVSMATKIEMCFCNFLWNDMEEHHRYYLMDWNTIVRPLNCGGLGLRLIREHNNKVLLSC